MRELIHNGIPDAGMPAFNVPEPELSQLVAFVRSRVTSARESMPPGDPEAGQAFFFGQGGCAHCHSMNGRGGVTGPDLSNAGENLTLAEMERSLLNPAARRKPGYEVATVRLRTGAAIRGLLRNESLYDLQLQDFDGRLHLLRRAEVAGIDRETASYMPALTATKTETTGSDRVPGESACLRGQPDRRARLPGALTWDRIAHPQPGDWPTYHGQIDWQPLQPARPDYAAQRKPTRAALDLPDPQRAPPGSDSRGSRTASCT